MKAGPDKLARTHPILAEAISNQIANAFGWQAKRVVLVDAYAFLAAGYFDEMDFRIWIDPIIGV